MNRNEVEFIITLEKVLFRINEMDFENLLGSQTVKILRLLNNNELYIRELRKITVELFGEAHFLTDKGARKIITNALRENEAENLADFLGISYKDTSDLYEKLTNKSITKNSLLESKLFEFFGVQLEKNLIDQNVYHANNVEVTPSYSLFKHQRTAAKEINEFLLNSPYRVLLHMPTGAGKTRTAMNIISDYLRANERSLVIWLATTEELCQQAFEEFEKSWSILGNREISLYKLWGDSSIDNINNLDGLVVAGLPKLVSIINSQAGIQKFVDFSTKLDFIVMDEAHQAIAPTYKFIIETIFDVYTRKNKKLLGLSATPGRTWNDIEEDMKLSNFFSNNKVSLKVEGFDNPVDYLVSEGYLAKVNYKNINYYGKDEKNVFTLEKYVDIPAFILKALGEDEQRNIQVILYSEDLAKRHNRIIVFAPSVESSNLIAFVLRHKGYNAFSLTGKTDTNLRRKIIEDYKDDDPTPKIIVNYGILTTGFDAPKTSSAIIARPTMSLVLYSQMVGRAIRGVKAGGNTEAEILTVIDEELPGFNNVADAFFNWEDVWN
ncbi:DEAD/DEAH box helicase [Planococcus kocurii]|uniref:DEAD/DEAH box helicase n=1 Tax=Planococcus kocurii TaxID=1374 RepID=UPI003D06DE9F